MLIDIPPFISYVRSDALWSHNEGVGYFSDATVFAISTGQNEPIRFQLMVNDTTMFSNIPVCALVNDKTAPILTESECMFDMCPNDIAQVIVHEYLSSIGTCHTWKKDTTYNQPGMYLFTCEFSKTKQQLHLIELEDGNYSFWANSHLTWGDKVDKLPEYNQ